MHAVVVFQLILNFNHPHHPQIFLYVSRTYTIRMSIYTNVINSIQS